jgi:hypothetical protein
MSAQGRSGGESAAHTHSQTTLGNWQNVQTSRRCSLRRGYRSVIYSDIENNRDFTLPPPIVPLS